MTDSPNLALPLIEAGQAQKHVTHNEALALLDALTQIAVTDMGALAPPASPANGARVVVGAGATGAFAAHAGKIAFFDEGAWRFAAPRAGWVVWSTPESCAFVFAGTAWTKLESSIARLQNLALLGVATSADAANPFSMRGANALFTARYGADGGDGDLRFKLNKESPGRTVSQLYQSNWSGRAETGLIGNDSWSVRRSLDGAAWTTALVVDPAQVDVPAGTPAAPGLSFVGDEDTGVYRPDANVLGFATGGVGRWSINASGHLVPVVNGGAFLGLPGAAPMVIYCLDTIYCSSIEPSSGFRVGSVAQGAAFSLWGDGDLLFRGRGNPETARLIFAPSATAAYPSLKRSGANLQVRTASDAAFTGLECGWVRPASFTVATVPSASTTGAGSTIYVSNESGGAVLAFSDGAAWRRVTDRVAIS
ncbi:MAG: DUF2793 domain-containing protein [Beijerinckiaceae bacterium]|nr:DUF2793 domain-containing protein [Beijerinckiaceae bacterium]